MKIIRNWDDVFLNLPKSLQKKILKGIKENEINHPGRLKKEIKLVIQKLDYRYIKKEIKIEVVLFIIGHWGDFRYWWLNVIKEVKEKFEAYNGCAWYIYTHCPEYDEEKDACVNFIPHATLYYIDNGKDYIISFGPKGPWEENPSLLFGSEGKFFKRNLKDKREKLFNIVKNKNKYDDKEEKRIYLDKKLIDVSKNKNLKMIPHWT